MSTRGPREKAVFCQALEIADLEQRRQFLDQACGADRALREEIEKLLAVSQSAGDFFKDCAPALKPAAADGAQLLSAAEVLGISEATAKRWWSYARAWLFNAIHEPGPERSPES